MYYMNIPNRATTNSTSRFPPRHVEKKPDRTDRKGARVTIVAGRFIEESGMESGDRSAWTSSANAKGSAKSRESQNWRSSIRPCWTLQNYELRNKKPRLAIGGSRVPSPSADFLYNLHFLAREFFIRLIWEVGMASPPTEKSKLKCFIARA